MFLELPLCALFLGLGIIFGMVGECRIPWLLVITWLLLLAGFIISRHKWSWRAIISVILVMWGISLAQMTRFPLKLPEAISQNISREKIFIVGIVDDTPTYTEQYQRVLIQAKWLCLSAGKDCRETRGLVELWRPASAFVVNANERVIFQTKLRPASSGRNPGVASSRLRFLMDHVEAVAYIEAEDLAVLDRAAPAWLEWIRTRVRLALTAAVRSPEERGVLRALLLGENAEMTPSLRQSYSRCGLSHILAISGLHLTLLAMGLLRIFRRTGQLITPWARRWEMRRLAAPLAAIVAIFYTELTGASPSALRSCVMIIFSFWALLVRREVNLWRSLLLAALVLLAWEPMQLFAASFQLSFVAMASVALVGNMKDQMVFATITEEKTRLQRSWHWLKELLLSSLAATLLTAPLVAHHFHEASCAGLLANIFGIPWSTYLMLPLGLLGAFLGTFSSTLSWPLLWLTGGLTAVLNDFCALLAKVPGAVWRWAPSWPVAIWAIGLSSLFFVSRRWRWPLAAMLALGTIILLGNEAWDYFHPRLKVTFLDVGQGDSIHVQLPSGEHLLIDGGGSLRGNEKYDPGARRVVPYLQSAGVRRLKLVVATHPHPDHIGGLPAVLENFEVEELWVCWHLDENPDLARLLQTAQRRKIKVRTPEVRQWDLVKLMPLWPAGYAEYCADPGYDANDNSIVLRLQYGQASALLAGDVEVTSEEKLAAIYQVGLRSSVLKVPHHGSATSSSINFIKQVSPQIAVISLARLNQFHFPAASVLDRYTQIGTKVIRTDELGALGVELASTGEIRWRPLSSDIY